MGLDCKESVARLEKAGIKIDASDQIFLEIAKKYNYTPKAVYDIIMPEESINDKKQLPAIPALGTGGKTFLQLCTQYQLNSENIVKDLKLMRIVIQNDKNMKELALLNKITSIQLYDMIKEISEREEK